jgi:hypothetical protein
VRDPESGREAHADFSRPFSGEALAGALDAGSVCRDLKSIEPASRSGVSEIGSSLFKAVFVDEILASWLSRLREAEKAGRALRLRLRLDSPDLWDWPWGFLATLPSTPVVRYLEGAGVVRPLRARPPVRVLVVAAHPEGLSPLAVPEELGELRRALGDLEDSEWVELELLEGATRARLHGKLQEKRFHILHFIGHGTFDRDQGGGAILLEGEAGEPDPMGAQELGVLLGEHQEIRLAVLNVCHGARGRAADPFSGLAQSLIRGGLPAVIAMQASVSDAAAILFSQSFYKALARREPLDRAVSQARIAMFAQGFTPEWGLPVLATRSPDFDILGISPGQLLTDLMSRIFKTWKYAIALGGILIVLGVWFRFSGRRWVDPNLLSTFRNPPECPSPPGLSIAFVKVEPPGKAPFCMARFETTQHLWKEVLGKPSTRRKGGGLPMVRVSWNETRRFLSELNRRKPGGRFRLPTGEEWEYAAKGGEENPPAASSDTANCANKEEPDGFEDAAPVGSYPPNPLGLYDMLGNVSEWVGDSAVLGRKIRRGGGFNNALRNCSVIYESALEPGSRPNDAGFRIVREPVKP